MKIIRSRRDILCGQQLPRFYGFAYFDYERYIEVAYPLGINKIVGWWRRFVDYMRAPPSMSKDRQLAISLDSASRQIARMSNEMFTSAQVDAEFHRRIDEALKAEHERIRKEQDEMRDQ